jgi:hypothetical protein
VTDSWDRFLTVLAERDAVLATLETMTRQLTYAQELLDAADTEMAGLREQIARLTDDLAAALARS